MVDEVGVRLAVDARQVKDGAVSLDQLAAAGKRMGASADDATRKTKALTASTASLGTAMRQVASIIGIGFGAQQIISMIDAYTKFTAQLKLVSTSQQEFARSMESVNKIAKAAQADISGVGVLYARIANSTRELGSSQQDVADITETISLALKAGGATAVETASAMLQLSQAFGSGRLAGQEFMAVNEAAPPLIKILAESIGVQVGAMKELSAQGEITAAMMARAYKNPEVLRALREQAAQVRTISGAFTELRNAVTQFVGVQAKESGAVSLLTGAIGLLADNLKLLAGILLTVTASKLAQWAAAAAVSIARATAAIMAMGGAAGVASGAIALLGGPIGAVITVLGLAATAWSVWGSSAKAANEIAKQTTKEATDSIIAGLDKQIAKHKAVIELRDAGFSTDKAEKNIAVFEQLKVLSQEIVDINAGTGKFKNLNWTDQFFARREVLQQIAELTAKIREEQELGDRASALTRQEARLKFMSEYATKQEQLALKLAEARKLLGDAFTPEDEARIRKAYAETDKEANKGAKATEQRAQAIADMLSGLQEEAVAVGKTEAAMVRYKLAVLGATPAQQAFAEALAADTASRDLIQSLQNELAVIGLSGQALAEYQQRLLGVSEARVQEAGAIARAIEARQADIEAIEAQKRGYEALKESIQGVIEELWTQEEALRTTYARKELIVEQSLERGLIDEARYLEIIGKLQGKEAEELKRLIEGNQSELSKFVETAAENMQTAMADTFFNFMQGEFENLGSQFKQMLDRMVANALAAQLGDAIFGQGFGKSTSKLGGWLGKIAPIVAGAFGGGGAGAAVSASSYAFDTAAFNPSMLLQSANGNVFDGGNVIPFAKGGIVSSPRMFPMANGTGLMGEAGPEAIMPLKRLSNGKLGVQASAPNNSVVVNVNISGIQDARGIREASANVAARTGAAVNAALARNR